MVENNRQQRLDNYASENIKRLRRENNLTQEILAEFLGVTFQSISNWERGESYPDITMLPEIAGFFKVSVDELLGVNRVEDEAEITKEIKVTEVPEGTSDVKVLIWKDFTTLKPLSAY